MSENTLWRKNIFRGLLPVGTYLYTFIDLQVFPCSFKQQRNTKDVKEVWEWECKLWSRELYEIGHALSCPWDRNTWMPKYMGTALSGFGRQVWDLVRLFGSLWVSFTKLQLTWVNNKFSCHRGWALWAENACTYSDPAANCFLILAQADKHQRSFVHLCDSNGLDTSSSSVRLKGRIWKPNMSEANVFGPSSLSPTASYAERQAYCWDVLNLPGPIDRWLTSNCQSPWVAFLRDYMLLPDIQSLHVVCIVWVICKTVSNCYSKNYIDLNWHHPEMSGTDNHLNQVTKFTLYITAVSPRTDHTTRSVSPRAVLEIFTGSKHALNALEWTQWTCPTLQFQQPCASFAALFARMVLWDVNRDDVFFPPFIFLDLDLTLTSAFPLISNDLMGSVHLGEFHLKYGIFVKLIHFRCQRGFILLTCLLHLIKIELSKTRPLEGLVPLVAIV